MPNFFSQLISQLLTSLIGAAFTLSGVMSGTQGAEIKTPEDFEPVLRFTVCSDIHLGSEMEQTNSKRYVSLFEQSYEYSENHDTYKKLDAVVFSGDLTDSGYKKSFSAFAACFSASFASFSAFFVLNTIPSVFPSIKHSFACFVVLLIVRKKRFEQNYCHRNFPLSVQ